MPVLNRIAGYSEEMAGWRRALHRMPELGFDLPRTAAFVAARLRDIGVDELHEGIAKTGIVAIIEGRGPGETIGLRADMDALPIAEATGADWASETPGRMHACGHDGHTTMLLGAAKYLAETRRFRGRVALIFQPAEEISGGAEGMIAAGVLDRFEVTRVFALHNDPRNPVGRFGTRAGPILAGIDTFEISLEGRGGHAAYPSQTRDPVIAAAALAQALQSVVSRNRPGREPLVLSVTQITAGTALNVVPEGAFVGGTVRSFSDAIRDMALRRISEIAKGIAAAHDVTAACRFATESRVCSNDAAAVRAAADCAAEIVGEDLVDTDAPIEMVGEDFGYMLEARPGAILWLGQGEGPGLHDPAYDFNDEIAPIGATFFARMVERSQPLDGT